MMSVSDPSSIQHNVAEYGEGTARESLEKHKLHHSYIWMSVIRAFPYIIIALAFSVGPTVVSLDTSMLPGILGNSFLLSLLICLLMTVIICGVCAGIAAISYKYIWYEFSPGEFNYYSGILNKKRNHIPYQRVQSVNQKMSLLQRLIGVCTVEIDTAGGSNNTAVSMQYIKREEAERVRREIFMRKRLLMEGMSAEEAHRIMLLNRDAVLKTTMPEAPVGYQPSGLEFSAGYQVDGPKPPMGYQPGSPTGYQAGISGAPAQTTTPQFQQEFTQGGNTQVSAYSQAPASDAYSQTTPNASAPSNILDIPAEIADNMRGVFGGYEVDTGKVSYEIGLSNKELILSALTGKTSFVLVLLGVISALFSGVSFVMDMNWVSDSDVVIATQGAMMAASIPFVLVTGIAMVLGVIVLLWVITLLGTCLSYGGFKARRRDDRIEVEHGIISHTFSGMDVDRIQTININQSFFQRILGYCSVSYGRVTAMTSEQTEGSTSSASIQDTLVVHPFLKLDRVEEVVSQLTPEHTQRPAVDNMLPRKAFRRAITRRVILQGLGFWLAVIVSLSWFGLSLISPAFWLEEGIHPADVANIIQMVCLCLYGLCVLIAIFEAIDTVMWYRASGFGFNERYVAIVNGGFSRSTVVVPRQKIQISYARTNPLQRLSKVATINVVTARGTTGKKERLIDASLPDVVAWLEWSVPRPPAS